jgi:hypothetical protein
VEKTPPGQGAPPASGWLPPEPPGPPPDLDAQEQGTREPPAPNPPPPAYGPPPAGWTQPHPGVAGPGYPPPPPYQAPQQPPPQYGWQPHPGWGHQPPSWPPPSVWTPYAAPDTGPGNGQAIAAFVLSLSGLALLLLSAGLLFVISIPCAVLAMVFGRKGKRRVDSGETAKHRGLAQAGWVIGIVTLVLSLLSATGWILAIATDPGFFDDLEQEPDNFDSVTALALAATRLGTVLGA